MISAVPVLTMIAWLLCRLNLTNQTPFQEAHNLVLETYIINSAIMQWFDMIWFDLMCLCCIDPSGYHKTHESRYFWFFSKLRAELLWICKFAVLPSVKINCIEQIYLTFCFWINLLVSIRLYAYIFAWITLRCIIKQTINLKIQNN